MRAKTIDSIISAIDRDHGQHGVYVEIFGQGLTIYLRNGNYEIDSGCYFQLRQEQFFVVLASHSLNVKIYDHGEFESVEVTIKLAQLRGILTHAKNIDLGH